MKTTPNRHVVESAPERLWLHDLREILAWYEQNICAVEFRDPRGHQVKFSSDRFPHLIKLLQRGSDLEVVNPQKHVLAIKTGAKAYQDYGGYDEERVQTLSWTPAIILRPTRILELVAQPLVGPKKAGDTVYIKQFANTRCRYKFKILVCRRVGATLLVPVTCHPHEHDHYSTKQYKQVWP